MGGSNLDWVVLRLLALAGSVIGVIAVVVIVIIVAVRALT